MRGRDPGRRRVAGHRGADAVELSSSRREQGLTIVGASTRSTCRPRGPTRSRSRSSTSPAFRPRTCAASAPRRGSACAELLEQVIADVPPPRGRPGRAAPRADLRFEVRPVPRRRRLRARGATARSGRATTIRFLSTGKTLRGRPRSAAPPQARARPTSSHAGQVGYVVAGVKTVADARVGDTIARGRRRSDLAAAARLPRDQVDGVLGPLPDRRRAVRGPQGGARASCALNDASLDLRARDLGRARLRLPLRLPRAAAPGDRPGAAAPRVRIDLIATTPSVEYHVLLDRRRAADGRQPEPRMPPPRHIEADRGAVRAARTC